MYPKNCTLNFFFFITSSSVVKFWKLQAGRYINKGATKQLHKRHFSLGCTYTVLWNMRYANVFTVQSQESFENHDWWTLKQWTVIDACQVIKIDSKAFACWQHFIVSVQNVYLWPWHMHSSELTIHWSIAWTMIPCPCTRLMNRLAFTSSFTRQRKRTIDRHDNRVIVLLQIHLRICLPKMFRI